MADVRGPLKGSHQPPATSHQPPATSHQPPADRIDVTSVGEVLIDFIAPDATDLERATQFFPLPGGAPANVAVAVARLGGHAAFVGAVGDDPFGATLRDLLSGEGVEIEALQTVTQRTTLAFVARNTGGIPDFIFYREADAELRPEHIPVDLVTRSRFLYVSSMALLTEPARDATLYAVELAREAGTLVALDPNYRRRSWNSVAEARAAILPLIHEADVVKINDDEARMLADNRDLDAAIVTLSDEKRLLVVTLGADGCRWSLGEEGGSATAPAVVISDTTGAGDAFMGALLYKLSEQDFSPSLSGDLITLGIDEAARFACAAGAYSCTRPGAMASLPTRTDVETLLTSYQV